MIGTLRRWLGGVETPSTELAPVVPVQVEPAPAPAPAPPPPDPRGGQHYYFLGPDLALVRLTSGLLLYVDPQDEHVSANMIAHGYWEAWVTAVVLSLLAPGARVVEVGANIGFYTINMAARIGPQGRITAFEANPRLVGLAQRSALLNGFSERIELIGKAALDQPGSIEFVTSRRNSGGGFVTIWEDVPYDDGQVLSVEAVRLDDVIEGPVDMIRIDAEGSEAFILRGAERILRENPGVVLCLEWSVIQMNSRTPVAAFVDWLAELGFRFWRMEFDATLSPLAAADMAGLPHCDIVASRTDPVRY